MIQPDSLNSKVAKAGKQFMLYHETNKVLKKLSTVNSIPKGDEHANCKNFTQPSVSKFKTGLGRLYCVKLN